MRSIALSVAIGLPSCFVAAALIGEPVTAQQAKKVEAPPRVVTMSSEDVGGTWVGKQGGKTTAGFYSQRVGNKETVALGFYKDSSKAVATDFAIACDSDGVFFQVVDDKGKIHVVPVTALLKLNDEGKVNAIRGPPEAVGGIGDRDLGKRLLVKLVKARAVDRLMSHGLTDAGVAAMTKPLTRAEAKALVDTVDDELIIKHASETYPKAFGEGGRLADLVDWLASHKEEILALVKFLISLLALFGI